MNPSRTRDVIERSIWGWRSGVPKRIVLGAAGVDQRAKGSCAPRSDDHQPVFRPPHERTLLMTLSEQLTKLAAKAKEAEDRATAAKTKAKAELEQDVKQARKSAQAQADQLHKNAKTTREISRLGGTTCSVRGTSTSTRSASTWTSGGPHTT